MFSTPNFRSKNAAIIWMLCLALALVCIDYFAGPVTTSKGWKLEVLWSRIENIVSIQKDNRGLFVYYRDNNNTHQGLFYNFTTGAKEHLTSTNINKKIKTFVLSSDMVQFEDGSVVKMEDSGRQGRLIWKNNNNSETIVRRLHKPSALIKDSKNNLYLIEHGRNRILKISHE